MICVCLPEGSEGARSERDSSSSRGPHSKFPACFISICLHRRERQGNQDLRSNIKVENPVSCLVESVFVAVESVLVDIGIVAEFSK